MHSKQIKIEFDPSYDPLNFVNHMEIVHVVDASLCIFCHMYRSINWIPMLPSDGPNCIQISVSKIIWFPNIKICEFK